MTKVKITLFVVSAVIFASCAEPNIVYKEVKIPVQCAVDKQERPIYTGKILKDFENLLIYSEIIERDLEFCRTGESK